jgi:ABC-2 type transport system ATP-binding protein
VSLELFSHRGCSLKKSALRRRRRSGCSTSGRLAHGENGQAMGETIRTEGLTKFYGPRRGLDGLDLEVREGEIFGFLGPNGAGKTTTIRLLLDVIRPTAGRATVLGGDPRTDGVALRRRIGYLPGDFVVDGRQTAGQLLTYVGNLRGGVPRTRVDGLAERLDLDLSTPIRSLSKGNRQKVGLVQAFMHDPELLILDEPTGGLDPLMQREFLDMITEASRGGQTVFMSSHVLSEVQRAADRAGIVRDGRLVTVDEVETLRERAVRRVELSFEEPVPAEAFAALEGVANVEIEDRILRCQLTGRADALVKTAARFTVVGLTSEEPDLEELFFAYYAKDGAGGAR